MMTTRMTPAAASEDMELVNASLAGNREAFGQIVTRYQSLVCSLGYSATGNLSQSEDLAQETFITAWKHLAELREPAKLRAWLCDIARNLINNSLRTQGREPSHGAESLEEIAESRSPEPLPGERAISQEEAEILWRSLERIPETYRLPLVLFYREHQSVEAVAQNLELTEDTVRQRLSRGRKLLQEEVLAFVEVALEKTSPGKTFTLAVVAALPIAVTTAKAASAGAAVAKAGTGAKSVFTLGALGGSMAMLGAILFSWKTAVDETKSPRERGLMVRMGWFQIAFLVVSLGASFYWLPQLSHQPLAMGVALSLLILANVVNCVVTSDYLGRRRAEIGMEQGTLADAEWSGPGKETDRKALRKTIRLMIPMLFLFFVGSIGLPWKQHWDRCAVVVAAEGLVMLWAFRRFQGLLTFRFQPRLQSSRLRRFVRQPVILLPAILFGSALLGGLLPFYLNPVLAKPGIPYSPGLRGLGWGFLAAALAYAVFAVIFVFVRKSKAKLGPEAIIHKTYAALFQQLNFNPDQCARLQDLVLKKTFAATTKSMALMNGKLDGKQRAELTEQLKSEMDDYAAQIRHVLGAENYQAFQYFEKTIPDRTMIGQFSSKSARTAKALSAEQQEQLSKALSEARAQFPWTTDLSRRNQAGTEYAVMFGEDSLAPFAQEEEQFDRQFLAQAQGILHPEQLAAFADFQKRQRQSQIAGFRMAAKMFAPKSR